MQRLKINIKVFYVKIWHQISKQLLHYISCLSVVSFYIVSNSRPFHLSIAQQWLHLVAKLSYYTTDVLVYVYFQTDSCLFLRYKWTIQNCGIAKNNAWNKYWGSSIYCYITHIGLPLCGPLKTGKMLAWLIAWWLTYRTTNSFAFWFYFELLCFMSFHEHSRCGKVIKSE